jgi:hypothetical protein
MQHQTEGGYEYVSSASGNKGRRGGSLFNQPRITKAH